HPRHSFPTRRSSDLPKGSAKISVYDHGLLYGDGVFEGIRAYNGIVFHLRDHIERLFEGLRVTRINVSLSKEEMANAVVDALRKKDRKSTRLNSSHLV